MGGAGPPRETETRNAMMFVDQVQDGELVTIFTDPPTKSYMDFEFKTPRWIKN